jgi:UDPglucose--hexose-1-phosphate uridylyltransferase
VRNPDYPGTFVFENDFAALKSDTNKSQHYDAGLLRAESEPGVCRVICFSPRHDLTISTLPLADLRRVVDT